MLLIDDLLFAPFSGWNFIMRTLLKVAEEQWTDDAPLKEKLLHLQVELEEGSITEEQYLEAEALILREIREVQRRKIELAGGDPDAFETGISGSCDSGRLRCFHYLGPQRKQRRIISATKNNLLY